MSFKSKEELLQEYKKCVLNTPYALSRYLQTYDNTKTAYVPLNLFEDQRLLLEDYETSNENIVIKYRQAGVSTVTAAWSSKKLAFASEKKPEKILIIANKLETAKEFLSKIRNFLIQWPDWLGVGFSKAKDSQSHFIMKNGCEVKAVATSVDALRGYTPTILIFDEAAYIEAGENFWAACMASLSTGGKVIVVSTPNGFDPIYYEVYDQAVRGLNNYKISNLRWYHDPRFTSDLSFIKTTDIVHYMLNRELYNDDEVIIKCEDKSKYQEVIDQGYKPFSSWYEAMAKKLKYDTRLISQELDCNFLGSGDNVFSSELIKEQRENNVREPDSKYMAGLLWVWKEPVPGHKYILGVDVSRGDSEDFSAFSMIDFDTREQVMEFIGKMPPDGLADIVYKWGILYNAYIVIDITGGMGVATSRKLQELGYRNLYVDGVTLNNWKYDPKMLEKIPGINFNSKRVQIIAALEENMRHGFKIRSQRMLNEMNTFVYINGKADHMKGHHDDSLMCTAMAIYVGECSFTQLQKADEQTKTLLQSWLVNEKTHTVNQTPISTGVSSPFDPFMLSPAHSNPSSQPTKQQYREYGWLFGGKPK